MHLVVDYLNHVQSQSSYMIRFLEGSWTQPWKNHLANQWKTSRERQTSAIGQP